MLRLKIIIDADSAPRRVLEICREAAELYSVELWTVASFNHLIDRENHITVGDSPQEADIKILNLCSGGDVVVTQDYGLAAVVISRGAYAISPWGKIYTRDNIDFLLEERSIKAKLRRSGGRTGGPPGRTGKDDLRFRENLFRILDHKIE